MGLELADQFVAPRVILVDRLICSSECFAESLRQSFSKLSALIYKKFWGRAHDLVEHISEGRRFVFTRSS